MPDVVVIGGPNGAGKTSWALRYLQPTLHIREFVNADEIARGLSPLNPEGTAFAAGRLLVERTRFLVETAQSFAFETTCAGKTQIRLLQQCHAAAYRITLIFLWLPSVEAAEARVARRVSQGGHNVPGPVIARRYAAGLRNMRRQYLPLADIALIYDNSDGSNLMIAEQRPGSVFLIHDEPRWNAIEKAAR